MSVKEITIDLEVKRKWYYHFVFWYLKRMIKRGKITPEEAADFTAKRCFSYSIKE